MISSSKILFLSVLILINIFFATPSKASSSGGVPGNPGALDFLANSSQMENLVNSIQQQDFDINSITNGFPVYSAVLPGSAGALACDFLRQLKCGPIPLVLISVTIFTLGMLTLMQKIRPLYAILMVGFIIVFLNADKLVAMTMNDFLGSGNWLGWMATKTCWCTDFDLWHH